MFEKLKLWLVLIVASTVLIFSIPFKNLTNYLVSTFQPKNDLRLYIRSVNPEISTLAADPSNKLVLRVVVKTSSGEPASDIKLQLSVDSNSGIIFPTQGKSNQYGELLATFIPKDIFVDQNNDTNINQLNTRITAEVPNTGLESHVLINLSHTPVVFIHGYQEYPENFDNMKDYLATFGYEGHAFQYKSEDGVIAGSKELELYLEKLRKTYLSKGIQVSKFDLITHSMGGLIARHYTGSESYLDKDNIRKIIFISVPHKGSTWASLAEKLFNDQGIRDLVPDNELLASTLPAMNNNGFNHHLQIGSIAAEYDEVVSPESTNLDEWGINTEIFNVGENNLTADKLLKLNLLEESNHKSILNNKKVFDKVVEMLSENLPHPTLKKQ